LDVVCVNYKINWCNRCSKKQKCLK